MADVENPGYMAHSGKQHKGRRPSAQTQGWRHSVSNSIRLPQQQIERCHNAQHDYTPAKEDKNFI
ncbi:MAG: hypothetical protein J6Z32_07370 [Bacteroidales bacterium]|nr:hypothetical protein [Bacteroidales bacterium]